MTQQLLVFGFGLANPWNRLFRNDQHMRRRFRVDVMKRQNLVIFKDDSGRDLAGNDFFE